MLIPINQLDFEGLDMKCFTDCNNQQLFQSLINHFCSQIDWKEVDLTKIQESLKDNPVDILNIIISHLPKESTTSSFSFDISKVLLCGDDNWNYTPTECLTVINECFGVKSLEAILSAIIKRVSAYARTISELNAKITDLTNKYTTLTAQITNLKTQINNCC